ncbi:hypothetical protein ACIA5D_42430 [Actinoplanes sp. NPDC051513]|uniref:hypothetical protein n=1 Tax=Actinoplanes sp. NPDC051513 TaxID=3363908 RepID=UPI0037B75BBD
MSMLRWWAVVVGGAAVALLLAWLGRLAGVPLAALLAVGGGVAALMWTVVLVTLPWNLYFDARQVLRRNAMSRERGISVPDGSDREAWLIARRTLVIALAGHVGTAVATVVFAVVTGNLAGYWLSAFYLVSTAVRPAQAFLVHLRTRLVVLRREGLFPIDDVATLKGRVVQLAGDLEALRTAFDQSRATAAEELRRTGKALADDHAQLRVQLGRLESAQATDRADYRALNDRTRNRIDEMARRIESTLDGIGDHQELLTGIRALVRMIRTEPA